MPDKICNHLFWQCVGASLYNKLTLSDEQYSRSRSESPASRFNANARLGSKGSSAASASLFRDESLTLHQHCAALGYILSVLSVILVISYLIGIHFIGSTTIPFGFKVSDVVDGCIGCFSVGIAKSRRGFWVKTSGTTGASQVDDDSVLGTERERVRCI